jgi:hypothetical protein
MVDVRERGLGEEILESALEQMYLECEGSCVVIVRGLQEARVAYRSVDKD